MYRMWSASHWGNDRLTGLYSAFQLSQLIKTNNCWIISGKLLHEQITEVSKDYSKAFISFWNFLLHEIHTYLIIWLAFWSFFVWACKFCSNSVQRSVVWISLFTKHLFATGSQLTPTSEWFAFKRPFCLHTTKSRVSLSTDSVREFTKCCEWLNLRFNSIILVSDSNSSPVPKFLYVVK